MKQTDVRRWLLAVDGSAHAQRAADYVARWARPLGVADVFLLNVQPLGGYRAYALNRNETLLDAEQHAAQAIEAARALLAATHVAHRFHTELGDAADVIVRQAALQRATEIVLGSRGLGPLAGIALGSVAYKVVHQADVPVTVVGHASRGSADTDGRAGATQRVLLAVDGSEGADRAVDYVCGFANERVRVEAVVVNVQLPILSSHVRNFVPQDVIDSCYRDEGERALHAARTALARNGIRFEARVMAGYLAQTIVQLAEREQCSRIVMGTRGLGAIGTVALGSTAYHVLHLAALPVTLVK